VPEEDEEKIKEAQKLFEECLTSISKETDELANKEDSNEVKDDSQPKEKT
jgi:hypothetical protein